MTNLKGVCVRRHGERLSGERTRLACWFRRRAETIFYYVQSRCRSVHTTKVRDREDALASTRAACAPQKFANQCPGFRFEEIR